MRRVVPTPGIHGNLTIGLAAVLMAVGLSVAATSTSAFGNVSESGAADGLRILEDSPGQLRGVSQQDGGVVAFTSRASADPNPSPGEKLYDRAVSTEVIANGDTVRVDLDPGAKTLTYRSSPGAVVSVQDKQALLETATRLAERLGAPERRQVNERALVLRTLAFLAEAPQGKTFPTATATFSEQMLTPSTCGTGELPNGGTGPRPLANNQDDGDGIIYLGCDTSQNDTAHDAASPRHDFETFPNVRSGPASGTEVGRCGAAGTSLQFGWTQDCLDHDFCVDHEQAGTGPTDDHCGDEWFEAVDDFTFTLQCQCSTFGFDCGGGAQASPARSPGRSERVPA